MGRVGRGIVEGENRRNGIGSERGMRKWNCLSGEGEEKEREVRRVSLTTRELIPTEQSSLILQQQISPSSSSCSCCSSFFLSDEPLPPHFFVMPTFIFETRLELTTSLSLSSVTDETLFKELFL